MGLFDQFRAIFDKPAAATTTDQASIASTFKERRTRKRINPRQGTRVLIIDDSPTVIAVLKKMLVSAGCVVLEAGDAETGIEVARNEKAELIFLDIILPGMNGFSALRALRRDPLTQDVPVIMISGNEQATEQFFGTRIGAEDFMKKPFSRFEVFSRIERLLDEELVPRRALSARTANEQPVEA